SARQCVIAGTAMEPVAVAAADQGIVPGTAEHLARAAAGTDEDVIVAAQPDLTLDDAVIPDAVGDVIAVEDVADDRAGIVERELSDAGIDGRRGATDDAARGVGDHRSVGVSGLQIQPGAGRENGPGIGYRRAQPGSRAVEDASCSAKDVA